MTIMPTLEVDSVSKYYGSFLAISDIHFMISKGEVVGLVGLNGAGKTTIFNSIMGFLRTSAGKIRLFGDVVIPENAHKMHSRIGFATGDMSLFINLTGQQYFDFIKRAYKLNSNKRLDELCKQFNPETNKKIRDLSRGNKQKIALIGAFMASPELVILDEPSSGLDPLMQQKFLELISTEAAKGTTIFMSSHYLKEVADVCSRVIFIRDGKLVRDIPRDELEAGHGKAVRIVTRHVAKIPAGSKITSRQKTTNGYEISFIFRDSPVKLQQWLSGLPQLLDFTIEDHDIESAFSDLTGSEELGNV
ncbi:MAG: ABC transporter ATP-binding protein [Candidatus Saccharibacteria bacterium]